MQADSVVAEPLPKPKNTGVKPISSLAHLPKPGIESGSPALAGGFFTTEPPGKPHIYVQLSSVQSLSRVRLFETP